MTALPGSVAAGDPIIRVFPSSSIRRRNRSFADTRCHGPGRNQVVRPPSLVATSTAPSRTCTDAPLSVTPTLKVVPFTTAARYGVLTSKCGVIFFLIMKTTLPKSSNIRVKPVAGCACGQAQPRLRRDHHIFGAAHQHGAAAWPVVTVSPAVTPIPARRHLARSRPRDLDRTADLADRPARRSSAIATEEQPRANTAMKRLRNIGSLRPSICECELIGRQICGEVQRDVVNFDLGKLRPANRMKRFAAYPPRSMTRGVGTRRVEVGCDSWLHAARFGRVPAGAQVDSRPSRPHVIVEQSLPASRRAPRRFRTDVPIHRRTGRTAVIRREVATPVIQAVVSGRPRGIPAATFAHAIQPLSVAALVEADLSELARRDGGRGEKGRLSASRRPWIAPQAVSRHPSRLDWRLARSTPCASSARQERARGSHSRPGPGYRAGGAQRLTSSARSCSSATSPAPGQGKPLRTAGRLWHPAGDDRGRSRDRLSPGR